MRIAILVGTMVPAGAEHVAVRLANAFAASGNEVDLVVVDAMGRLSSEVSRDVEVVDLHARRARYALRPFRSYLRKRVPDAVLAIALPMNLVAAVASMGLRRKPLLLLSIHAALDPVLERMPRFRRALMTLAGRRIYDRADWVIAVSNGVAADVVRHRWATAARVRTIYNPVLPDNLNLLASAPAGIDWLEDRAVPTILSVGRLTPQKNFALLIDAFALVTAQRPARLLIAGEGECRTSLERQISQLGLGGSVRLLGDVANAFAVMRAADLFVLSSDYEGFGNVLIEAMAVGTAVVSTDCPHGPREILEGGKWGRLVRPGDAQALASAILDALDEPGPPAIERALQFRASTKAAEYLALIESHLRARPPEERNVTRAM